MSLYSLFRFSINFKSFIVLQGENMEILTKLVEPDKFEYKCFDELKKLLNDNENFRSIVIEGYQNGKIYGFPKELWDKIKSQNIFSEKA